jgi:hypothetical protein
MTDFHLLSEHSPLRGRYELHGSFGQGSSIFGLKGEPFFEGSNTFEPFLLILVDKYNE